MTGSLVFVNDVLVGNAIDNACSFLENFSSNGFVAGFDGLTHAFDRRTQHRAQAGVVFVALYRLASTFAGLGGIGHYAYPVSGGGLIRQRQLFYIICPAV